MKKRIKIFESGSYKQGVFNRERVKKIFSAAAEKTPGIFAHTSMWKDGNEIPEIASCENIGFVDKGNKLEVHADINFNEKGESYYNDGILKSVSVEIANEKFNKIGILPIGVKQAVESAEFSAETTFHEFQEIIEEDKGGTKEMTREEFLATLTKEEITAGAGKLNLEVKEKAPEKSPEEIKTEAKAELEGEIKVKEFMEQNKLKIIPALHGFMQKLAEEAVKSDSTFEFNKKDTSVFEGLCEFMKAVPESELHTNYSGTIEFTETKGTSKSPFQQGQQAIEGGK